MESTYVQRFCDIAKSLNSLVLDLTGDVERDYETIEQIKGLGAGLNQERDRTLTPEQQRRTRGGPFTRTDDLPF